MSPKSIQSDSFTFVYSLTRIFYHLGLHEEVFRVGQKSPPSHTRVIPLPLCTHSQGYFIIRTTCNSVWSWSEMSPKSIQSDSFTFVYSLTRIFHHLGLHVTVFGVGHKCPPSQSRVIPLPLCTHSQGYFIT
jgi:hypothetical protein